MKHEHKKIIFTGKAAPRIAEAGSSIIEAIIAVGILGGAAVMIGTSLGAKQTVRAKQDTQSKAFALNGYAMTFLNCANTTAKPGVEKLCNKPGMHSIDTYTSDDTLLTASNESTMVGPYGLTAKCSQNGISFQYKPPGSDQWKDLANGIPVFCPGPTTPPTVTATGTNSMKVNQNGARSTDCGYLVDETGHAAFIGCNSQGGTTVPFELNISSDPSACQTLRVVMVAGYPGEVPSWPPTVGVIARDTDRGGNELSYMHFTKSGNKITGVMADDNYSNNYNDTHEFWDYVFELNLPTSNFTIQNTNLKCK